MTRLLRPALPSLRAAACVVAVLASTAGTPRAVEGARSACALHPASGDVPSDPSGGMTLELAPAKPAGLANWDVRWWQRHRLGITLTAVNRGDAAAVVVPE